MWFIDFRLVFVIVAIINTVENRRYDIEHQCRLEYGTDLNSVLRQFRRSDDYVTILKMRTKEFDVFFTDILYQGYEWNLNKMNQKIIADFGLDVSTPVTEVTTTTKSGNDHKLRMLKSRFNLRRQASGFAGRMYQETIANVRRIDRHPKLNQYLSVAQRNHYKSVGFQYVGDIIHTVIFAFGGSLDNDGSKSKHDKHGSTVMSPGVTQSTAPTTKHALRHTVEPIIERDDKQKNVARTKAYTENLLLKSRMSRI